MIDTKKCPDCAGMVVLFCDCDQNNTAAMGLKCSSRNCGWKLTFKDLLVKLDQARRSFEEIIASEKYNNERYKTFLNSRFIQRMASEGVSGCL